MMDADPTTLKIAIIGAVCGVTGVVLGIVNTWHQLQRNKVRLQIIPAHAIPLGAVEKSGWNFSIEVINMSEFPLTISDVGFIIDDGTRDTLITAQGYEKNGSLPLRLEPRSAYSKYFHVDPGDIAWSKTRHAYALTLCGTLATGTSGVLKQLIREGRAR